MYRKKIYLAFLCIVALCVACIGMSDILQQESHKRECNYDNAGINGGSVVSRSSACKMLALLFYSHSDITSMPQTSRYEDIGEGSWYDKYYNAADTLGIIWGEDSCRPGDNLTCNEALGIYRTLTGTSGEEVSSGAIGVYADVEGIEATDEYISFDSWIKIYNLIKESCSVCGEEQLPCRNLYSESVFLISIIEDEEGTWKVATDKGPLYFDGYAIDAYTNVSIDICTDGEEIVYITGQTEGSVILNNVMINDYSVEHINVFCYDMELELGISENVSKKLNQHLTGAEQVMYEGNQSESGIVTKSALTGSDAENYSLNLIADLKLDSGVVTDVTIKSDRRNDKLIAVTDEYIETASYGRVLYAPEHRVYSIYDGIHLLSDSDINIGYSIADIVLDSEGKVCAVLITGQLTPELIRVAIMTTGYKSHYHKSVSITSDCGMEVFDGNNTTEYQPGEVLKVKKNDDRLINSRFNISPKPGGMLTIASVNRAYGNPVYRGRLELAKYDKGIVIVNELPIEEYLYAVVPSEMPSDYGIEPLKAQAVCARGYAYKHIMDSRLANIGAHVDDSTSYQVYNNTRETDNSIQAVNNTGGQVLQYDGEIISAYYFSTSCGYTANGSDVWLGMKEVPYLAGKLQNTEGTKLALAEEKDFISFISSPPCDTFDTSFPWYRWNVTLTSESIKASLEKSVQARYEANPSLIKTKGKDGKYYSRPVTTIGDITGIKVAGRREGGIVTEIIIKGTKATIKVISEYNIRILLAPSACSITRCDGTVVRGLSLLPSAFFYIDSDNSSEDKGTYMLKGGGYGHGVGMSQNGAKTMADAGYSYVDILKHYYTGCEISYGE